MTEETKDRKGGVFGRIRAVASCATRRRDHRERVAAHMRSIPAAALFRLGGG